MGFSQPTGSAPLAPESARSMRRVYVLPLLVIAVAILALSPISDALLVAARSALEDPIPAELPGSNAAALKLTHAQAHPRYDVGLFGNSRIVGVTADDLGLGEGVSVYNFAIGGAPLRQSVGFIEELAEIGKVPRVVVVLVDDFRLNFGALAPFPGVVDRLSNIRGDVFEASQKPSRLLPLKVIHDALSSEFMFLKERLNIMRIGIVFGHAVKQLDACEAGGDRCYAADGSLPAPALSAAVPQAPIGTGTPNPMLETYLLHDMSRLARIAAGGTRVILVQSPIAEDAVFSDPVIVEKAARLRPVFLARCRELGLECPPSPRLGRSDEAPYWRDTNHAPGPLFGREIGRIITQ